MRVLLTAASLLVLLAAQATRSTASADTADNEFDVNNRDKMKHTASPEQLDQFEQHLLKMLGLNERPRPARDVTVPAYMLELFRTQGHRHNKRQRPSLSGSANTIRSHDLAGMYAANSFLFR